MTKLLNSLKDVKESDCILLLIFSNEQMEKAVVLFNNKNLRGVVKWFGISSIPTTLPKGFVAKKSEWDCTIQAEFDGDYLDMVRM